ncbi:MAG: PIN domain-containing protein [Cecembia sp.]
MIVVVDTNIIFSAILSPKGTISDLLLNSKGIFEFYTPTFIIEELDQNYDKLIKLSKFDSTNLDYLKLQIFKKIELIDVRNIAQPNWEQAFKLVMEIDEDDTPFVALSLELKSLLWTGDKKLSKGLIKKGVKWVMSSEGLKNLRKQF